jgi:hypothetical protein
MCQCYYTYYKSSFTALMLSHTLQAADLVEGKRRAGPTSSVVARIYSQLEEQRVEHEHDNEVDEDRGVGARCPHGSYRPGWD